MHFTGMCDYLSSLLFLLWSRLSWKLTSCSTPKKVVLLVYTITSYSLLLLMKDLLSHYDITLQLSISVNSVFYPCYEHANNPWKTKI